jgi:hypothetical protein
MSRKLGSLEVPQPYGFPVIDIEVVLTFLNKDISRDERAKKEMFV